MEWSRDSQCNVSDATLRNLNAAEKGKALAAALAQIEKQFGKGSVMRMDANMPVEEVQTVSTGSLGLDIALGVGGLPRGRIVEIYGPESSGKTTPHPAALGSALTHPEITTDYAEALLAGK